MKCTKPFLLLAFLTAACQDGVPTVPTTGPGFSESAQEDYRIIELGTLGTDLFSFAWAINNRGQVVGWSLDRACSEISCTFSAFLWEDGVMTYLGTLGGDDSWANDINERGQIVGWSTTATGESHAFLWEAGVMTDLGPYYAVSINNRGQIAGEGYTGTGELHAFLWEAGTWKDVGSLPARGVATSINDRGQVAAESGGHMVLWDQGVMRDLGVVSWNYYARHIINNRGQVVATRLDNMGKSRAFLWENGTWQDLGVLPGGLYSSAYAINDRGQVVGSVYREDRSEPGFLWENGVMTDLGTVAGLWSRPCDINESGVIAGALESATDARAVIWRLKG